ncbi:MAG: hypothetical protein WBG33_14025 [Rhodanobacter sp.]
MNISVNWATALTKLLAASAVCVIFLRYFHGTNDARLSSVLGLIAGFTGTLLGFLITAVALLTAVMDRHLVENMRRTGHYQRLVSETFATCIGFFVSSLVCMYAMLFDGDVLFYLFAEIVFMVVLSCILTIEAGRRFLSVVSAL